MAGMSKAALDRCRRLEIVTDLSSEDSYTVLSVIDPRQNNKIVATYRARSETDVERVKRAYMGQFRIPKELVTESNANESREETIDEAKTEETVGGDGETESQGETVGDLDAGSSEESSGVQLEVSDSETIDTEELDTAVEMPPSNENGGEDAGGTDQGPFDLHKYRG